MAAAEALRLLEALLAKRPCGSAPLKAGIAKAEAASAALGAAGSGAGAGGCAFQEALLPRLQAARKLVDVEKVRRLALGPPCRGACGHPATAGTACVG